MAKHDRIEAQPHPQQLPRSSSDALSILADFNRDFRSVIDNNLLSTLFSYCEETGVSAADSLNEAISDWLTCCAATRLDAFRRLSASGADLDRCNVIPMRILQQL